MKSDYEEPVHEDEADISNMLDLPKRKKKPKKRKEKMTMIILATLIPVIIQNTLTILM